METKNGVEEPQITLESLGLSSRIFHALRRVGIKSVDDVLKMLKFDNRLPKFSIPNFGKKGYEEVIAKLHEKGYIE